MEWLKKIFGTKHQRDVKRMKPLVDRINQFDEQFTALTDEQLKSKTQEFKDRLKGSETTDDILCEAFAVVKNACRRLCGTRFEVCGHELEWNMVPFDSQLMGGMVLHQSRIAEMATGEGKTLVATLPLYLNALAGRNVHLVTVNDYLARRDAQWMGLLYNYLGVTVGCIQNSMSPLERREHYGRDITYGTNSEFGFDYLRDNGMAYSPEGIVQRDHFFAIVDEVDSILIDEARTPLIISGPVASSSTHQFFDLKPRVEQLVRRQRDLTNEICQEARELLDKGEKEAAQLKLYQVQQGMPKHKQLAHLLEDPDIRRLHEQIQNTMLTDMRKEQARELREELYFNIDERGHDATLTEKGCESMNPKDPDAYVLPDLTTAMSELDGDKVSSEEDKLRRRQAIQTEFAEKSERIHTVDQLIRAFSLYERDVEYVVQENQVLIVDEYTGRILPGRRWSDGLHQAVEAKEGVHIEKETQTLATITIQNYFRMYSKLAGMTGTAETEASEFHDIYKLDVVVIPTNRPVRRVDYNDLVYKTHREKYKAVIDEITECHQRGQPVLVGTVSVDSSELLSRMLRRAALPHNVLNAKNHEREAEIVTRAGQPGAVTIATNMAGRGTDIKLGESVVWVAQDILKSKVSLDRKVEGAKTLRDLLLDKPCGLHVIGSERHESRRIDRQLRGRCARQGDPGSSRFYVSLEDTLMRLFGSDKIAKFMARMGMEEGQPLEAGILNRSIETAQRRVEQQHFSVRKRTLQYDDVMNKQREIVYKLRGDIVRSQSIRDHIKDIFHDLISSQVESILLDDKDVSITMLGDWARVTFPVVLKDEEIRATVRNKSGVVDLLYGKVVEAYDLKIKVEDERTIILLERQIVLQSIDTHWQEYLRAMDDLRQGVGLRAYGQRDPLIEYQREAYQMFEELMHTINQEISSAVFRSATSFENFSRFLNSLPRQMVHAEVPAFGGVTDASTDVEPPPRHDPPSRSQPLPPITHDGPKVNRNDPCPCGSGKKYKKCCGQ